MTTHEERHPALDTLAVALAAPVQVWSSPDGQVREASAQGVYCGDDRVLARVEVTSPATRWTGDPEQRLTTDGLTRTRTVTPDGVAERYRADRALRVEVRLRTDASTMAQVRVGDRAGDAPGPGPELRWSWRDRAEASLTAAGADVDVQGRDVTLVWELGADHEAGWALALSDPTSPLLAAPGGVTWPQADGALGALLVRSAADTRALRMQHRDVPGAVFLAAGAPWYLTLFGRDSLISASLLRPVDRELAAGTLRVLAAFQGVRDDVAAAEEPGKILHELRRTGLVLGDGIDLPPVYYGTVDATLLWVRLLHDVWRDGDDVSDLLPALENALTWLDRSAGDGFVSYLDASGHGLANQGWKDSADAIRHADGTIATGPIALVEVQGYAYAAALSGAALLDEYGGDGDGWRSWAADFRARFRAAYWVDGFPALALDGGGRPVASLSSNIGHLLGTGLLDTDEARTVADLLVSPALFSGYGVRTLAADHAAYDPVSYHRGSVWSHDTALAIHGLLTEGFDEEAATLAAGLLRAAEAMDFRLPELFSGRPAEAGPPEDYPSSCRPQAWAAASAVPVTRALGGLPH